LADAITTALTKIQAGPAALLNPRTRSDNQDQEKPADRQSGVAPLE